MLRDLLRELSCVGMALGLCVGVSVSVSVSVSLTGCSSPSDKSVCGDGLREGKEECDGDDFGAKSCEDFSEHSQGELRCSDACEVDTSQCYTCGNNAIEGPEVCDASMLGGETCTSRGFYGGTLLCAFDCLSVNASQCEGSCGDGEINGPEVCDGEDVGEDTCESLGHGLGSLTCLADCSGHDVSGCLSWVGIPGGAFDMGSDAGPSNEQPVHAVTVPDFEMTRTQITVGQYAACVDDGQCDEPATSVSECNWNAKGYENHPANCVTWHQAAQLCHWLGGRLPSEAEWEYAARSGGQDIAYPWGDAPATCQNAVMLGQGGRGCGTGRTWQVCSRPSGNTSQGLCDMAGNVWEWVRDWYHSTYEGAPDNGSAWEVPVGTARALRGGSFVNNNASDLRATKRIYLNPGEEKNDHGFRCARDIP